MKTTFSLFLSCLFCLSLVLVSGCGKSTGTSTGDGNSDGTSTGGENLTASEKLSTLPPAEDAEIDSCSERLREIALAFHTHHDAHNSFPPLYTVDKNGKPLHSWRVHILPYLEQPALYKQIRLNEPWDSKHNSQFHSRVPYVYQCPSHKDLHGTANCTYSVITSNKTAFSPGVPTGKNFNAISDGTSNTIAVVEVKKPFCWMDPTADLTFEEFCKGVNGAEGSAGSFHSDGINVAFFDGSVHFLRNSADAKTLSALATIGGGESISASEHME